MPAIKHLAAARRPNLASPPVVRAAVPPNNDIADTNQNLALPVQKQEEGSGRKEPTRTARLPIPSFPRLLKDCYPYLRHNLKQTKRERTQKPKQKKRDSTHETDPRWQISFTAPSFRSPINPRPSIDDREKRAREVLLWSFRGKGEGKESKDRIEVGNNYQSGAMKLYYRGGTKKGKRTELLTLISEVARYINAT